jgi:drug/metabolite transporter superfamily protein YnfA
MIFILNNFLLNKNMHKFLIINIVILALFFIFVATNNSTSFTTLGYAVLGMIYLVINSLIYFCLRYLKAIEKNKTA